MGGGDTTERTVQQAAAGPPQIIPEFQPYAQQLGQRGVNALTTWPELQLQQYLQGQQLNVPGLTPMGMLQGQQIADRGLYGIPTPQAETQSLATLNNPGGVFQNLMTGNVGDTPAWQQALTGLQTEITPAIQNQMAKSGLSQSTALPDEIGRAYAKELVPLAQQFGQQQLQAGAFQTQQLGNIAQQQYQRPIEQLRELGSQDELQRNIQLAQGQAAMDAFNRNLQIAAQYNNPFAQFQAGSGNQGATTNRTSSGGGWGFGK